MHSESASAHGAITYDYDSGPPVTSGRLATWLFLAAEALFFGGLISAWGVLRAQTPGWHGGEVPSLTTGLVMTGLLLGASWLGHTAIAAARGARHKDLVARLGLTMLLVIAFLCVQVVEYGHLIEQELVPATSVRWAMFYAMTLCHGLHVLIGLVWLLYLGFRAVGPGLDGERAGPLEYGVLYLHFVDFVWLVLLVLLYIVR